MKRTYTLCVALAVGLLVAPSLATPVADTGPVGTASATHDDGPCGPDECFGNPTEFIHDLCSAVTPDHWRCK